MRFWSAFEKRTKNLWMLRLPVKIVHREACVAGNFVEALSGADCLVDCVIIVVYFIRFQCGFHSAGKAEAAELVVKHLKKKRRCPLHFLFFIRTMFFWLNLGKEIEITTDN